MMTFITFLLGIQLYIFFVDKDKIIINAKNENIDKYKLDGKKSQNILEKIDEITDVILEYKIKHEIKKEVILEIETKINIAKTEFIDYFLALKYLRKIYRYKISLTQDYIAIFDANIHNNNKILSGITTLGLSIYSAIYFMFGHITDPKSGLFFPWLSKKVNMETAHCIIECGFYIILCLFILQIAFIIYDLIKIALTSFCYNRFIEQYQKRINIVANDIDNKFKSKITNSINPIESNTQKINAGTVSIHQIIQIINNIGKK